MTTTMSRFSVQGLKSWLVSFPIVVEAVNRYRNRRRSSFDAVRHLLEGAKGLEIGGPTALFGRKGAFPLYTVVGSLDNVNWSSQTYWSEIEEGMNFRFDDEKRAGRQVIADSTDISVLETDSYDLVVSSHVIEHIANPLRALAEWRRVLKPGGHMVIVAPDKRYTYDRNRPVTKLAHIIEDFEKGTPEDDTTHYEEIIALHDMAVDGYNSSYEQHVERTTNNGRLRMAHHHVFDEQLFRDVVKQAGFEIIAFDVFRPYHLLIVAINPG